MKFIHYLPMCMDEISFCGRTEKRGSWMKLDELLPSLRFAPVVVHVMHGTVAAAAVACLENCVAVLPRSLAPSLACRNFTKPIRRLQYPICCYYLQLKKISLQFQFPDLQVYREAFAEEETDGETERQKKWQVSGSLRALSSRRWEWWKNGAGSRM